MPPHLRDWLLCPVRTPARAALSAAALALLMFAGWYGLRLLHFRRAWEAARSALASYDFPEARRQLDSCLAVRPNDPAALLLAVQAARRDGLIDDAQQYLDRYREQVEGTTPEGALQGVLLQVQLGQVKEHVKALLDLLEVRHPDSEQIFESLAQGCVHVYRLDEAQFWTKQLLDRFPDNPVGRLIESQTNETLRRRERATELARKLVEDYPDFDKARLFLGELLVKGHKYDEATRHYEELHRRNPADVRALLGLVRALLAQGRLDEAGPRIGELERRHPDTSEALLESGRFALRQKRPADAEPLLRRAARLAPGDYEVEFELARCLAMLGRTDESQRHLERFRQIQADMMRLENVFREMVKAPGDPAPRLEAGQICLRNGQDQEGLRWLYGALEVNPSYAPAHAALAEYYERHGDAGRAETHRRGAAGATRPK